MSWKEATNEISYQNLIMLSATIPRYNNDEEGEKKGDSKGKDLFSILSGHK